MWIEQYKADYIIRLLLKVVKGLAMNTRSFLLYFIFLLWSFVSINKLCLEVKALFSIIESFGHVCSPTWLGQLAMCACTALRFSLQT